MSDSNWSHYAHTDGVPGRGSREGVPAFVSRRSAFFVLLAVLLVQLLFLSAQITRGKNVRLIQVWALSVFSPCERAVHGALTAATNSASAVRSLWSAEEENRALKAELAASKVRIQQLSQQASETGRLRTLLDLKTHLPYSSLAAEVIAASPGDSSMTVLIDHGKDAGLTPDLAVITPDGIVGKTVAVYAHTAEVLLITDPSSGVGAMIESSRIEGIMRGSGRTLCQLRYIMDDEKVSPGDSIVTSGMDQIYPKGLVVGTVVRVANGNIYKNIDVKPASALDRLETVLILLTPGTATHEAAPAGSP
jgi:rod shape-determining protein MreC